MTETKTAVVSWDLELPEQSSCERQMGAPICERAAFCWNGIISVSHSLFFYCTELEDCVMHEYRASLCLTLHTNVDFPVRVSDSYLRDVVCFVQNRRSLFTTAVWSFYIISNVLSFCVSWLDGWNLLKIWTAKLCSHLLKSIQKCWWLFLNCLTSPQLVCGLLQTNLSCLNIVSVKFCCVSFSDWDVPKFTDSKFRFYNFSLKSLRTRTKLQSRAADRHQHTHTQTCRYTHTHTRKHGDTHTHTHVLLSVRILRGSHCKSDAKKLVTINPPTFCHHACVHVWVFHSVMLLFNSENYIK